MSEGDMWRGVQAWWRCNGLGWLDVAWHDLAWLGRAWEGLGGLGRAKVTQQRFQHVAKGLIVPGRPARWVWPARLPCAVIVLCMS